MDKEQIKAFIPHRDGMLLLDEASVRGENSAEGIYHVRGDEFFLQGHFPGNPVVPGVMLCEMMAQTCGVILARDSQRVTPYFAGIRDVKFKHTVRPGDTIRFVCEITRSMGHIYLAHGKGTVDGTVCVQGDFSFAVLENAPKE